MSCKDRLSQIEERFRHLKNVACLHPELEQFMHQTAIPALNDEWARVMDDVGRLYDPIAPADRMLTPSDFGFHNAIRQADGTLMFVDFEYFGWDDPVKLAADFLLHPVVTFSHDLKQLFLDKLRPLFNDPDAFAHRLRGPFPLYALRWCAIVLNPFIAQRRTASRGVDEAELSVLQSTRLERAKSIYNKVFFEDRRFSYVI